MKKKPSASATALLCVISTFLYELSQTCSRYSTGIASDPFFLYLSFCLLSSYCAKRTLFSLERLLRLFSIIATRSYLLSRECKSSSFVFLPSFFFMSPNTVGIRFVFFVISDTEFFTWLSLFLVQTTWIDTGGRHLFYSFQDVPPVGTSIVVFL